MSILYISDKLLLVFLGSSSTAMKMAFSLLFRPVDMNFLENDDFPVPVSPTMSIFDPLGIPPPRFVSNSLLPVLQTLVSRETMEGGLGSVVFFAL